MCGLYPCNSMKRVEIRRVIQSKHCLNLNNYIRCSMIRRLNFVCFKKDSLQAEKIRLAGLKTSLG